MAALGPIGPRNLLNVMKTDSDPQMLMRDSHGIKCTTGIVWKQKRDND